MERGIFRLSRVSQGASRFERRFADRSDSNNHDRFVKYALRRNNLV